MAPHSTTRPGADTDDDAAERQAASADQHVIRPGFGTRRLMNPLVTALTRLGIGPFGAQQLLVRGRVSGAIRRTPVNPLSHDGALYLVAARGHVEWTKNLRSAGECQLRRGRRIVTYRAVEATNDEKSPVLRHYLRRWAFEVGMFFDGVGATSTDAEIAAIASRHPVFRLHAATAQRPA